MSLRDEHPDLLPESIAKRNDWAFDEMTRDPIFLLQRRSITVSVECYRDHGKQFEEECYVPCDECQRSWHTVSVWLSRAEAERYAKATAYNYPDGWQVYCLCAEGELALLLRAAAVAAGADHVHQSPPRSA